MHIRILSAEFESFVPDERMDTEFRSHMEFDENTIPLVIDKAESVDAKPLHHSITPGDCTTIRKTMEPVYRSDITHITIWDVSGARP